MTDPGTGFSRQEQPSDHAQQFLLWVAARPRTYAETMEAWRTSCPRLSAWEDAMADALICVDTIGAASHGHAIVRLTAKGAGLLGHPGSVAVSAVEAPLPNMMAATS